MTPRTRHTASPVRRKGIMAFASRTEEPGTLAALRRGERVVIDCIACPQARAQALRFGVGEGASITCVTVVPGGPVVLRCGRQEIAFGRGLARRITVRDEVA